MTVYIDNVNIRWKRGIWCHMTADTLDELHEMARKIGMRREWFQDLTKTRHPHYDVTKSRKKMALELGAIEVDARVIVAKSKILREELLKLQENK